MSSAEANPLTRVEVLEELREQAAAESRRLGVALSQAQDREAKLDRELQEARERALRQAPPPATKLAESKWRTAARELDHFNAGELAAEVGVPRREALAKIKDYVKRGVLTDDGHQTWRFVKPDSPGEAFTQQQRLRAVEEPQRAVVEAVAGTGKNLLVALPKDVRSVVRDAIANGWALSARGDGHFTLRKGKLKVTVNGSPRVAATHAMHVKRNLASAENG